MIHRHLIKPVCYWVGCVAILSSLCARSATLEEGGSPLVFAAPGDGTRSYARTARADFAKASFQAEVTVTLKGGEGSGSAYFGMGCGEASGGPFFEPTTAPVLFCRLGPSNFAGGVVTVNSNNVESGEGTSTIGDGTHRIRLTWDATGKRAMFEICRNWDGKAFRADSSITVSAENIDFGEKGHLFVGGANGLQFADFTVREMSGADIKAEDLGETFGNDRTAGTWLPTSPADHDGMRLLACWYNGPKLMATRAFTNGAAQTPRSQWSCSVQEKPVEGEPGASDLDFTFKLTDGSAKQAGVAVAFDFANWSASNYVLIPASVYNGNRNRIEGRGYATGLNREDLYKKDLHLTTCDLPQLSPDLGNPSRLEVLACNASTPAMCFYNHQTKRAFIVLSQQGILEGDHIRDNAFSIEESADRSHATLVVSAPGVRERKPEFIGFSASPDRGIDWNAGDEVHLRLRTYSFETPDIPGLLDKFMTVRKAVTGPNHPRNLIPFSEVIRLMTARIDSRFYSASDSQFYCPEGQAWISFGWIGGLMDTFPMLALGDKMHLERVTKTFDFAIPQAQGKTGYFHCLLNHDGKIVTHGGYDDHPELVLTRMTGDVLFWMLKQFLLLKAQGRGDAIKPEWEHGIRRLADAFVSTWKKYGQWGNFINVDTGEVAVYNTTSGASAIGGLVLASKYFHEPEYLNVAEQAATYYYNRDVIPLGMTTGACGDILQNAEAETPTAFTESLMALYWATDKPIWLDHASKVADLLSTWVVSYDYVLPPDTELAQLGAKLAGAVWASTQNKHGAPGLCTSSGNSLFKIYRATGDTRYAELIHDIAHAHAEGIQPDGEITERLTYCDAEMRGSRGSGSTGWNELNGILMAMELPGIYLQTDKDRFFVFDHVEARALKRDASGASLQVTNPTKFDAKATVFAENARQARQPLGYTSFLNWPAIAVKAGATIQINISPDGRLQGG